MKQWLWLIFMLGLWMAALPAKAAEPPSEPMLRLETGMHTAMIKRIGVDAAGRWLVSASIDKTLRVWSLADGSLAQTLRVPIGAGNEGNLFAAAISPDGTLIAAGGYTGAEWDGNTTSIYLFNRASGQVVRRIDGLGEVILHLAFSVDGRYLAASLGPQGLRVFRSDNGQQVAEDRDYGGISHWCDFAADGRLVTSSWDGYLRLYDARFQLQAKQRAQGGGQPWAAVFSPDGKRIAVGFADSTRVVVLDGHNLSLAYEADSSGVDNGTLSSVAWSADGASLYAGGRWVTGSTVHLRRWNEGGRGSFRDLPVSSSIIMDIRPLPGGAVAVGSGDPALTLLARDGSQTRQMVAGIADYRQIETGFLLSHDGVQVKFGFEPFGKRPASFDLSSSSLSEPPATTSGLTPPDRSSLPQLSSMRLKLKQYEISRSLAIAPDRKSFLLGTEWSLRRFDDSGKELWQQPVPGEAWGVNISGDGKKAVAAFGDGTIRWYDYATGAELLAFFPHADGKRWVLWTPEGFFDHSPGGEKLIGYHLNRGKDKAAEFIPIDRLYDQFYRPDLVAKKFSGNAESEIAEAAAKIDLNRTLQSGAPPRMAFVSPTAGQWSSRDVEVVATLTEQDGGIGRVEWKLNGMTVGVMEPGRGIEIKGKAGAMAEGIKLSRTLTLAPGDNTIELVAYSKMGVASNPVALNLNLKDAISEKPALHILVVGVNKYRDKTLWLNYAVPDAEALASSMKAAGGSIFTGVHVTEVYDQAATMEGIKAAFERVAKTAASNDVFILYLAGHGITMDGRYHFLPADFRYHNEDSVRTGAINQDHLQRWMADIPAMKNLVLLDTCNSGSFVEAQTVTRGLAEKTAIDKLIRATGRAIISASTDTQVALEGYEGHGIFTYALLEAMKRADGKSGNKDGVTSTGEIANFVQDFVPDVTYKKWGYEQVPQVNLHGREFPVGVVR